MSRIDICIFLVSLSPGGAEKRIARIVQGLNKSRFKIRICCLGGKGPLANELESHGIKVDAL